MGLLPFEFLDSYFISEAASPWWPSSFISQNKSHLVPHGLFLKEMVKTFLINYLDYLESGKPFLVEIGSVTI
jgi:hypothetical protein